MAVPKWLRGRPPSPAVHVTSGFCFLAIGVFWLTLGGTGASFQAWHLVFGVGWLALAVAHFVSAVIRKKRDKQRPSPTTAA
jgi:hypothetical protein